MKKIFIYISFGMIAAFVLFKFIVQCIYIANHIHSISVAHLVVANPYDPDYNPYLFPIKWLCFFSISNLIGVIGFVFLLLPFVKLNKVLHLKKTKFLFVTFIVLSAFVIMCIVYDAIALNENVSFANAWAESQSPYAIDIIFHSISIALDAIALIILIILFVNILRNNLNITKNPQEKRI